jgi:hypothetical protein
MTKNTELNRDLIMTSLSRFYGTPCNVDKLVSIVDGKSPVSLRLIDWSVTSYFKNHNVELPLKGSSTAASASTDLYESRGPAFFNVYNEYRAQLRAFSKHNFDPFKRRDRIRYHYTVSQFIITTVGQLNFFKWAIENGIINFIEEHRHEIEADMVVTGKIDQSKGDAEAGATKKDVVVASASPDVDTWSHKPRKSRREACTGSMVVEHNGGSTSLLFD